MHRYLYSLLAATTLLTPPPAAAAFVNEADALRACELAIHRHASGTPGRARFEPTYARTRDASGFTFYINASVASADGGERLALRSTCRARGFAQVDHVEILPGRWDIDGLTTTPARLLVGKP